MNDFCAQNTPKWPSKVSYSLFKFFGFGLTRKRVKALRDKNLYNPRQKARVQASDPIIVIIIIIIVIIIIIIIIIIIKCNIVFLETSLILP